MRGGASATQVPLFALFAQKAPPEGDVTNSNNAKGGTTLVASSIEYRGTGARFWHTRRSK
jgi:hypothetical protein